MPLIKDTTIAGFKKLVPKEKSLFWGDDAISTTELTPIDLADQSVEAINNLIACLESGELESDWTPREIKENFDLVDIASSIELETTRTELEPGSLLNNVSTVQKAIEVLSTSSMSNQSILTEVKEVLINAIPQSESSIDLTPLQNTLEGLINLFSKDNEEKFEEIEEAIGRQITLAERAKLFGIQDGANLITHASELIFTPYNTISSINTQDAIEELYDELTSQINSIYANLPNTFSYTNIVDFFTGVEAHPDWHVFLNQALLDQITDLGSGEIITTVERAKLAGIETGATRDQEAFEVPYNPADSNGLSSLNVKAALDELSFSPAFHSHSNKTLLDQITSSGSGAIITASERTKLSGIESNAKDDQTASEVLIAPLGSVPGPSVQDAVEQLQQNIVDSASNHPHDAQDIDYDPSTSGLSATDVKAAIDEVVANNGGSHSHNNQSILDQISDAGSGAIISTEERDKLGGIECESRQLDISEEGVLVTENTGDINFTGAGVDVIDDGDGTTTVVIDGAAALTISDEGNLVLASPTDINFVGGAVTVSDDGDGSLTVQVQGGSGAGSDFTVSDEGIQVMYAPTDLNFTGDNIVVTDDGDGTISITVSFQTAADTSVVPNGNLTSTDVQSALEELQTAIDNFVDSDNQEAFEVPYDNTTSGLAADDVQEAIDEVEGRVDQNETNITDIQNDITNLEGNQHDPVTLNIDTATQDSANLSTQELQLNPATQTTYGVMTPADKLKLDNLSDTDDQVASEVPVTPTGNISSTDVQAALEELQTDIDNFVDSDNQEAFEVPYDNTTSGLTADDVQEAIDELDANIDNISANSAKQNLFFDDQPGNPPPTPVEATDLSYNHLLLQESPTQHHRLWIWKP